MSRLKIQNVPEGVRVSGPDPHADEADLRKIVLEREQLEKELKNTNSLDDRARIENRLKWLDEVVQAITISD